MYGQLENWTARVVYQVILCMLNKVLKICGSPFKDRSFKPASKQCTPSSSY